MVYFILNKKSWSCETNALKLSTQMQNKCTIKFAQLTQHVYTYMQQTWKSSKKAHNSYSLNPLSKFLMDQEAYELKKRIVDHMFVLKAATATVQCFHAISTCLIQYDVDFTL